MAMTNIGEDYTPEKIDELVDWFRQRKDKLPAELQYNASSETKNLPQTVERLLACADRAKKSISFIGYMSQLCAIRDRLIASGME